MTDRLVRIQRFSLPGALVAVSVFFAVCSPGFAQPRNLGNVLLNDFALLAIAALGMTLALSIGAVDLSLGTAIDVSSLVFVLLSAHHVGVPLAAVAALGAALLVGAFNGMLVAALGIAPFLATLGTLFIGQTLQQLATDGGQPVYLLGLPLPPLFGALAHGTCAGVPVPLWIVAALALVVHVSLAHSVFGRYSAALGTQPGVARYSGLPVAVIVAATFVAGALIYGVVGLLLSSMVKAYVPQAGNGYLLNAIGATFIGTTLSRARRPNVPGTLLGVLLLSLVANGLLLIGWNFYWQQVATGVLIFAVLAFSFASRSEQQA
ncbi:ribose transport system permease protein [Paraburkholderia atlantica]|uniref:Ribose transport system permease protein n=1 Tax=Paraburkholderia atlantica TaxID=2654982 RepID=A0A6I1Q7J9_PARAM|nr:ABC transporter permease [Paraburkholderia atlantica]MBB5415120.1 ribose transport system permease protein [Paraburkholderia atlantica]MBB5423921.1 ribose transport system permease protein [Paraburkholderia atlantica]MPW08972.1 ABC transporter permease [Paraburkholderia atlantica]